MLRKALRSEYSDVANGDVEVLREHLGQRGDRPLTHFDLPGEAGHMAVLADAQEGVEIARRPGAEGRRMRRLGLLAPGGPAPDDPAPQAGPDALEEFAAGGQA